MTVERVTPAVGGGQIYIVALGAGRAGGAEVYTSQLVRELSVRGYSVKLLCHEADSGMDAICTVQRLPRPSFGIVPMGWRVSPLYDLYFYRNLVRSLRAEKPMLIIASAQYLAWASSRVFTQVPIIYVPHSLVAAQEVRDYPWDSRLQRLVATRVIGHLECRLLERAVRTVRFTRSGCEELLRFYGSRVQPRFEVFPPAVPLPGPLCLHKSDGPIRILFVGRLVKSKNVAFLLAGLAQQSDLAWQLDVVGDGPERRRLEDLTLQYGMAGRVVFHGHRADVARWYTNAHLLAFPSRLESVGLVILEAMSFGVPAVTIRADGHDYFNSFHEFITDGENGFIADDEPGFVHKLASLIRDRKTLAEAGGRARKRVEERHTWDFHINCYETLFSQILNRPPNPPPGPCGEGPSA